MEPGFEGSDLSVFDLCQTYNLTILVESWPTCTNRKKNLKLLLKLKFLIKDINADILQCQFKQTFATLQTSADNELPVYFNFHFKNKRSKKNITKELSLPTK